MGMFPNLSKTKIMGDAVYTKYGKYFVRIDKVKRGATRLQEINIIVDYTVLAVLPHQEPPPNHQVGEEACHYILVTGNEYAAADWAGFVSGMMGCEVADLENPEVKAACGGLDTDDFITNEDPAKGPVQPFRGLIGELSNRLVMTKEKPGKPSKPFTKVKWVREVPASEVLKALTPDLVSRFFPGTAGTQLQANAAAGR